MSDAWLEIIRAAIIAIPPTIVAAAAWRSTKVTHRLVNSRMDELLKMTRVKATKDERDRVENEKKAK